jgi:Icc-related predicted phosphoesterase
MTRRLTVTWPDHRPFEVRDGAPIRILAVSDAVDPALDHAVNRDAIGRVDVIVGCGDLEPSYLGFLADAFCVPVAFVRGNHDRGEAWERIGNGAPQPLESGRLVEVGGITVLPMEWPGIDGRRAAKRDERRAWLDTLRAERSLLRRSLGGRSGAVMVISHVPPRGVGDAADPYHVGFAGYRWLLERHHPPVWLHGHTTLASVTDWRARFGSSTVANVTGAIVVELAPPA